MAKVGSPAAFLPSRCHCNVAIHVLARSRWNGNADRGTKVVNTAGETQQGPANEGTKDLIIEDRGHVRLLTLNRPHRANALSPELMSALVEAFVDAGADPEVRALSSRAQVIGPLVVAPT